MIFYTRTEAFKVVKDNTDKPLHTVQTEFKRAIYYLDLTFPITRPAMEQLEEAASHALDEPFDINIDA